MGICKFERQSIQDLQTNNQQVIYKTKNEKQASEEDRYFNFDNYIKHKSCRQSWRAEISNDEKYLAILGKRFKRIYIYQLKSKKIIKIIQSKNKENNFFATIKFSNNSRHLLVADENGQLYCYDINNNFKLIYNQKVHSDSISHILTIDDDQILTSHYNSLIITNIKSNQQLLKIDNDHTYILSSIDFDKFNGFIIGGPSNNSIYFFNRKDGKCQIEQQDAHSKRIFGIEQVQLISKDNNLISSSRFQLILWQIDYQRLKLNKVKEFNNHIYHFTSVLNNNKIVVISDESILILDKDLVLLQSIKHNIEIEYTFANRQLNSLNYIIIPGKEYVQVYKKVRRLKK